MGLLDGIMGQVAGSLLGGGGGQFGQLGSLVSSLSGGNASQAGNLLAAAASLLQQNGGLTEVLAKFEQAGLGSAAQSWVGTGPNASIDADQLTNVLGSGAIGQVASQLGMSNGQAGSALAQLLPEIINQLTPQGQVPGNHADMLAQGLALLKKGGF